jgi:hypothetical protein
MVKESEIDRCFRRESRRLRSAAPPANVSLHEKWQFLQTHNVKLQTIGQEPHHAEDSLETYASSLKDINVSSETLQYMKSKIDNTDSWSLRDFVVKCKGVKQMLKQMRLLVEKIRSGEEYEKKKLKLLFYCLRSTLLRSKRFVEELIRLDTAAGALIDAMCFYGPKLRRETLDLLSVICVVISNHESEESGMFSGMLVHRVASPENRPLVAELVKTVETSDDGTLVLSIIKFINAVLLLSFELVERVAFRAFLEECGYTLDLLLHTKERLSNESIQLATAHFENEMREDSHEKHALLAKSDNPQDILMCLLDDNAVPITAIMRNLMRLYNERKLAAIEATESFTAAPSSFVSKTRYLEKRRQLQQVASEFNAMSQRCEDLRLETERLRSLERTTSRSNVESSDMNASGEIEMSASSENPYASTIQVNRPKPAIAVHQVEKPVDTGYVDQIADPVNPPKPIDTGYVDQIADPVNRSLPVDSGYVNSISPDSSSKPVDTGYVDTVAPKGSSKPVDGGYVDALAPASKQNNDSVIPLPRPKIALPPIQHLSAASFASPLSPQTSMFVTLPSGTFRGLSTTPEHVEGLMREIQMLKERIAQLEESPVFETDETPTPTSNRVGSQISEAAEKTSKSLAASQPGFSYGLTLSGSLDDTPKKQSDGFVLQVLDMLGPQRTSNALQFEGIPEAPPAPPLPPTSAPKRLRRVIIPRMAKLARVENTIWENLDFEGLLSDEQREQVLQTFEEGERVKPVVDDDGGKEQTLLKEADVSLLDPRRRTTINIMLKKTKIDASSLSECILGGRIGDIPAEIYNLIAIALTPPSNDPLLIDREREALLSHDFNAKPLSPSEMFLRALYQIPRISEKTRMIIFVQDFPVLYERNRQALRPIMNALAELRDKRFLRFLAFCKEISNTLLDARGAGVLDGFKLSSLRQFASVRTIGAKDQTNLLAFILKNIDGRTIEWITHSLAPILEAGKQGMMDFLELVPSALPQIESANKELHMCTGPLQERFRNEMEQRIGEIQGKILLMIEDLREIDSQIKFYGDNDDIGFGSDGIQKHCRTNWRHHGREGDIAMRDAYRITFFRNLCEFCRTVSNSMATIREQRLRVERASGSEGGELGNVLTKRRQRNDGNEPGLQRDAEGTIQWNLKKALPSQPAQSAQSAQSAQPAQKIAFSQNKEMVSDLLQSLDSKEHTEKNRRRRRNADSTPRTYDSLVSQIPAKPTQAAFETSLTASFLLARAPVALTGQTINSTRRRRSTDSLAKSREGRMQV